MVGPANLGPPYVCSSSPGSVLPLRLSAADDRRRLSAARRRGRFRNRRHGRPQRADLPLSSDPFFRCRQVSAANITRCSEKSWLAAAEESGGRKPPKKGGGRGSAPTHDVGADRDESGGHRGGPEHRSLPSDLQELPQALQVSP